MTTRSTMLTIAREVILLRAILNGYCPGEYDPIEDNEGYIISLITALQHWSDVHGMDWQADLARAQQLFEEDLQECRESQAADSSV